MQFEKAPENPSGLFINEAIFPRCKTSSKLIFKKKRPSEFFQMAFSELTIKLLLANHPACCNDFIITGEFIKINPGRKISCLNSG